MDRVEAFRRGSHDRAASHRSSVTWKLSTRRPGGGDNNNNKGGGDSEVGGAKKDVDKDSKAKAGLGSEIGLWYGGSLFMNAIIGPGIFGTPKGVLAGVGSVGMCMVMWTFAGLFSMCAALCFAELRESVRREGVEYAYITEAFGPMAGFVYSWMRIAAAEPMSTAVFALVFTDYVTASIYDDCGPPRPVAEVLATFTILTMALVNVMSTKLSERLQNLAIVGKVCALSVVIIMGVVRMIQGETSVIDEGMDGTTWSGSQLGYALYSGLWAYGGWSNVNHVTSGIKKPPRNVPRVVKTVLPLVLIVYILVVLSWFTAMTRAELLDSRAIGVTWAKNVLGPASSIITIAVGFTCLGSLNATFLAAGRLSGVAAKNGQMPDVASWVHVRSKTPLITVATRCLIATLAILVFKGDSSSLLRFYIFCVWLFHGMSVLALLVLRYKNKHKNRPYKVDLWIPVVVVIGIVFVLLTPFLEEPELWFILALVGLGTSVLAYWPINRLKETKLVHVPDKITIWLQLFLRIAPKRDLRRARHSMMRRMSMLARDSILITPNDVQTPEMMRRFSRRMSRMSHKAGSHGSPALIRKLEDEPQLRRRMNRGSSLAEADMKGPRPLHERMGTRSSSLWDIVEGNSGSPALIRKKPNRTVRSFGHADTVHMPSPPSLPILKNRFNRTPFAQEGAAPGALAPPSSLAPRVPNVHHHHSTHHLSNNHSAYQQSSHHSTHQPPRRHSESKSSNHHSGHHSSHKSPFYLSSESSSHHLSSHHSSHSSGHQPIHLCPSPIPEELSSVPASPNDAPSNDLPKQYIDFKDNRQKNTMFRTQSEPEIKTEPESYSEAESYQVVADFESDGGGEYEVLAHGHPPHHGSDVRRRAYPPDDTLSDSSSSSGSDSDSETDSSDKENGIRKSIFQTLFASHSSNSSTDSDSDSSLDEEGELDDEVDSYTRPSFYYSDGELSSDVSGDDVFSPAGEEAEGQTDDVNESHGLNNAQGQGHSNSGIVVQVEDEENSQSDGGHKKRHSSA